MAALEYFTGKAGGVGRMMAPPQFEEIAHAGGTVHFKTGPQGGVSMNYSHCSPTAVAIFGVWVSMDGRLLQTVPLGFNWTASVRAVAAGGHHPRPLDEVTTQRGGDEEDSRASSRFMRCGEPLKEADSRFP